MKSIINIKYIGLVMVFLGAISMVQAQTLEDYLQIAAENNPSVKAAYSDFEAALQRAPQVSSLPDPTLTVSAFGRMIETRLGAQEARFSLMQMFPWFGTLQARKEVATAMAETKFHQYINRRSALFVEVKTVYAELYVLEKNILLKEDNLKILDSYRELGLSSFQSGRGPMVNVIKTDIERESAKTEIELLNERRKPLQAQFNLLLNRNVTDTIVIQDTLTYKSIEVAKLLSEEDDMFDGHPAVVAIDQEKLAYEKQIIASEKDGLPQIGLGVDYSIISKRTDANPVNNGRDAVMPMVSVTLPIFRKKYRAAIKEAELMQASAENRQQAQKNDLKIQYANLIYDMERADRLNALYTGQLERIDQTNRLYISAFANNTANFDDILLTNQQKLLIQTQQLEALKLGFTAQAQLDYLLSKTEDAINNE